MKGYNEDYRVVHIRVSQAVFLGIVAGSNQFFYDIQ